MRLKDALNGIEILGSTADLSAEVCAAEHDSRRVAAGTVFAAIPGADSGVHGIKYAAGAVAKGSPCVLCDADCPDGLPYVRVENAEHALALLCANLEGHPADRLKLIAVTGTNGKTTVTHLVREILEANGIKCGLIGTSELIIGDKHTDSPNTTPEAPLLHKIFAEMAEAGCVCCVMEVSSHAIATHRVDGLSFEAAAFTNLSQDHLNFHASMDEYAEVKSRLFAMAKISVINYDDARCAQMLAAAAGEKHTFSTKSQKADLCALGIKLLPDAVEFLALTTGDLQRMRLGIPGAFSVSNALAAIGLCRALGLDSAQISAGLAAAHGVKGRAEVVRCGTEYTVMIDYAHSPDSLENILATVRGFTSGRIIVVFGCGGDRDRGKRPIMGGIAERLADICVVTSDNPRTEEPEAIISEITAGMTKKNHVTVTDRRAAIAYALGIAKRGDTVLLAGKGHETYQDIGGEKRHFDEREVVAAALAEQNGGHKAND